MHLVWAYELWAATIAPPQRLPPPPPPTCAPTVDAPLSLPALAATPVPPSSCPFRRLMTAEIMEHHRQGLCYTCDELYIRGHLCMHLFNFLLTNNPSEEGAASPVAGGRRCRPPSGIACGAATGRISRGNDGVPPCHDWRPDDQHYAGAIYVQGHHLMDLLAVAPPTCSSIATSFTASRWTLSPSTCPSWSRMASVSLCGHGLWRANVGRQRGLHHQLLWY